MGTSGQGANLQPNIQKMSCVSEGKVPHYVQQGQHYTKQEGRNIQFMQTHGPKTTFKCGVTLATLFQLGSESGLIFQLLCKTNL